MRFIQKSIKWTTALKQFHVLAMYWNKILVPTSACQKQSQCHVSLWQWTWGGIGRKVGMLNIVSLGLHLYINWYFVNYKYTSTEKLKKKTQIHTRHNVTKIMSQCHTENDVAPLN